MDRYLKKISKVLRNVTRAAKKGVTGITRSVKKLIHRGGNPNAVPAPAPARPSKRRRKAKGAFRRVTNAVRHVGKRFRNTLTSVFSRKTKHRRNKKGRVQKGSSENISGSSGAVSSNVPGVPAIPPAPPL